MLYNVKQRNERQARQQERQKTKPRLEIYKSVFKYCSLLGMHCNLIFAHLLFS